jgi:subtilisin family serine protease
MLQMLNRLSFLAIYLSIYPLYRTARNLCALRLKIMMPHLLNACVSTISVLGTVGGTKYGIAKKANLISVKVLNRRGSGSAANLIAGIDWVAIQPRPNGAVINMSLGFGSVVSPVDEAVNAAVEAGVVVVVAGGNANSDACNISPASNTNAITVGATAKDDSKASFSNFGSCIDIFAPGVDIISCGTKNSPAFFSYSAKSGTSMASPHVAGVAALLLEENPDLTPALLAQKLLDDATSDAVYGAGNTAPDGSPNLMLYTGAITGLTDPTTSTPTSAPTSAPSAPTSAPTSTPSAPTSAPTSPPSTTPVQAPTTAPTPNCAADFASCNVDSDCCSDSCKGGWNNRFCK